MFMNTLTLVIVLALISTISALAFGLVAMGKGGDFDQRYGETFMWGRVILQGLSIILLGLALWLNLP